MGLGTLRLAHPWAGRWQERFYSLSWYDGSGILQFKRRCRPLLAAAVIGNRRWATSVVAIGWLRWSLGLPLPQGGSVAAMPRRDGRGYESLSLGWRRSANSRQSAAFVIGRALDAVGTVFWCLSIRRFANNCGYSERFSCGEGAAEQIVRQSPAGRSGGSTRRIRRTSGHSPGNGRPVG